MKYAPGQCSSCGGFGGRGHKCPTNKSSALPAGYVAPSTYEQRRIEYEAALIEAMDSYFNARQGLTRTQTQENIFEGGFRMAWEVNRAT